MKRYLSKEEINEIIEKYKSNVPQSVLAKEYGVSSTTIGRKLLENGLKQFSLSQDLENKICEYYLKRKSLSDTAKEFGYQTQHIAAILFKYNIDTLDHYDVHRKYSFNKQYFDVIDNANKAYILGMWAADGNVCSSDNSIMLGLQEEDVNILHRINEELESDKPLQYFKRSEQNPKWKNIYRISIYSYELQNALISHGVVHDKSHLLQFPNDLDNALLFHYLRGYFDGDGHVSKDGRRVNITSTCYFCEKLMKLLNDDYNINCYVDYCNNNYDVVTRNLIICRIKDVAHFGELLYENADIFMKRKYERFLNNKYFHIQNLASSGM